MKKSPHQHGKKSNDKLGIDFHGPKLKEKSSKIKHFAIMRPISIKPIFKQKGHW